MGWKERNCGRRGAGLALLLRMFGLSRGDDVDDLMCCSTLQSLMVFVGVMAAQRAAKSSCLSLHQAVVGSRFLIMMCPHPRRSRFPMNFSLDDGHDTGPCASARHASSSAAVYHY